MTRRPDEPPNRLLRFNPGAVILFINRRPVVFPSAPVVARTGDRVSCREKPHEPRSAFSIVRQHQDIIDLNYKVVASFSARTYVSRLVNELIDQGPANYEKKK
jgi:hypothetical protein